MNTKALRHVRKLFCHENAPRSVQRHNCRQWVRSIRFLGDKWLLAKPINRIDVEKSAASNTLGNG